MNKLKNWYSLSVIVTLLNIVNFVYLTYHYYQIKLGLGSGPSFCNITPGFNCDVVTASNYSALWGVPIAQFGLFGHLVLLIFLIAFGVPLAQNSSLHKKLCLILASIYALTSVVMGAISLLLVDSFCLFCILGYILSFANLFFIYKWQDSALFDGFSDWLSLSFGAQKWVLILTLLTPAFAFVGNKMFMDSYGFKQIGLMNQESLMSWQAAPKQNFNLQDGLSLKPTEGTYKMTIVEFADFRCPHCKTASPVLHNFAKARKDVQLVFKPFPLDGVCNPGLDRKADGTSCFLAAATFCAEKLANKGWATHDWIFENQEQFFGAGQKGYMLENISRITTIAQAELEECVDSQETSALITKIAQEGLDAKVPGTPAIFVNDKKLDRGQFMPILEALYKTL